MTANRVYFVTCSGNPNVVTEVKSPIEPKHCPCCGRPAAMPVITVSVGDASGSERLWTWFGLSYATFLVMPRVFMHAMPDDWQERMSVLLEDYNEAFPQSDAPFDGCRVSVVKNGRYVSMPPELLNYRHPDRQAIARYQK